MQEIMQEVSSPDGIVSKNRFR